MALGMKQWLGLVAIGFALVALRTLPPKALELPTRRGTELQADRRLGALRSDAVEANNALQRLRWAKAVIPATLAGEGPVVFGFPEGLDPKRVESVRSRALSEVSEAGENTAGVSLGLFFVASDSDRYPNAPIQSQLSAHYYFGERDGRAYCVVVQPLSRQAGGRLTLPRLQPGDGSYLGVCEFVRRYGIPGPAVQAWLADGGTALASSARPGGGTLLSFRNAFNAARRGPLGIRGMGISYFFSDVEYDRCFAGVSAGCAEIFLHPERGSYRGSLRRSERTVRSYAPAAAVQSSSIFEPADHHVAANLAEEFGRDRFMKWWKADGDVSDAFQASFGVDVGSWNLRRLSNFVTITRPGPGVTRAGLVGTLLLLALSTLVAGFWARRRRVA